MSFENAFKRQLEEEDNSDDLSQQMKAFVLFGIGVLIMAVICPFVVSRQRRNRCYRRCVERNWNAGREFENISIFRAARPSYPIGDPRHRFTKEEVENETKRFLIEKLNKVSKILDASDFITDESIFGDIEMGKNEYHSFGENESLENFTSSIDKFSKNSSFHSKFKLSRNPTTISDTESEEDLIVKENRIEVSNIFEGKITNKEAEHTQGDQIATLPKIVSSKNSSESQDLEEESANPKQKNPQLKIAGIGCFNLQCAICLETYALGEKVTWSALDCNHVFHQACILKWLMTIGNKAQQRDAQNIDSTIMQHHLYNFDMICPVCRKDFICK